jgi:hypothetical protein
MVLESAGFLVLIATDIDEVKRVVESRNPDLPLSYRQPRLEFLSRLYMRRCRHVCLAISSNRRNQQISSHYKGRDMQGHLEILRSAPTIRPDYLNVEFLKSPVFGKLPFLLF